MLSVDAPQVWNDDNPLYPLSAERMNQAEARITQAAALAAEAASSATAVELDLGEVAGVVKLDLSKASVFRATVTGATTFEYINIPAGKAVSADLIVTQDAVGGHLWTVKSIEWINGEPTFATTAKLSAAVPVLILLSGSIVGFGASAAGGTSLAGQTTPTVTALGEGAGGAATGVSTTIIGGGAGGALTTGESNTALGALSLAVNKVGKANTALGVRALNKQTGTEATGVGYEALCQNTANNVTAVGSLAAFGNTTATGTVAVGHSALFTNKEGTNNTALGAATLEKATAGGNTAVGTAALNGLTTGSENTGSGRGAMESATTGSQNSALGCKALFELTTGGKNTALGYRAGAANKIGEGNVFIGWEAGAAELGSNKLYIHNSASAEPLILGDFAGRELTHNATKIGFYKGVAPVAQAATFAALGEAGTSTIKQLEEQVNKLRTVVKGPGLMA
jgi:hypothetical protein